MEVTGGEGAAGGRRGCLAAILGPSLGGRHRRGRGGGPCACTLTGGDGGSVRWSGGGGGGGERTCSRGRDGSRLAGGGGRGVRRGSARACHRR